MEISQLATWMLVPIETEYGLEGDGMGEWTLEAGKTHVIYIIFKGRNERFLLYIVF